MRYNAGEWIRLICYLVSMAALAFLAYRRLRRHNWPMGMFFGAFSLFFLWLAFDLTLVSIGLSTRDTRSFATPILVFVACSVLSVAWIDIQQQRYERQLQKEFSELAALYEVQH